MTPPSPQDSTQGAPSAVEYARKAIGPASARRLEDPALQVMIQASIRGGVSLEDAVLAEVHRLIGVDRSIADEFIGHFLGDLMRAGHAAMRPRLRRFLDTGDLVQSVLGGTWQDLAAVEFRTRAEFAAYLKNRIFWKAGERDGTYQADKRSEGKRVALDPADAPVDPKTRGPDSIVAAQEASETLTLLLTRLKKEDQDVLRLHLRGDSNAEIATALGLKSDAVRQRLHRAIERAKALVA